jgi:RND family efflux transporter MFP subunit
VAAARQAVNTARARLAQLLGPRETAADVTAARLDVRRAEADLAVLEARMRGSDSDVALARLRVDAARARLAAANHAERLLTVRAPSPGIVAALLSARGAPVDPTTPIAAVADLSNLAVSVQLSEFDAASVKKGLDAIVSVDALGGKEFEGTVLFVGITGTDSGGVVTFPVRIGLDGARGLKPGMNVSVRIIVAERADVVQVPLEAISYDDEDVPSVLIVDAGGGTSLRTVSLGVANNQLVEIKKGVRAGERVALPASEEGQGEGEEE